MIYGALLIFAPVVGALVLTSWLGAYAIVFRFALMAVAIHCTSDSVTSRTADVATPTELSCPITPYSCRLWVIRDRAEQACTTVTRIWVAHEGACSYPRYPPAG